MEDFGNLPTRQKEREIDKQIMVCRKVRSSVKYAALTTRRFPV
jgi:hypothetical protein